ncbi:MAG: hypothetical protein AAB929_00305 [Patescibacteria group bacterium]
MKPFRFSPIKNKGELFETITYLHFESFKLLRQNLGYILPVSGNVGVFCHFEDEFERLIEIRKELTDIKNNWNQKYFRLHKPIVIPAEHNIPGTKYTHLYIRRPEASHPHVGDIDFYLEPNKYKALKESLLSGKEINGVKIFERPDLDLVRLFDSKSDVSVFVGMYQMSKVAKT